jgi:dihydrofolate reductase
MDKRSIIAQIAISADGFIARADGNFDWLNEIPDPPDHYGMGAFLEKIDTILWGRKTWEQSLASGGPGAFGPQFRNYVFSSHPPDSTRADSEFVREPVDAFARRLRSERGKDIWIMGGGGLIASFLDAGEIDEFSISVVPVFIGEGIPLIAPRPRHVGLALQSTKQFSNGVVQLNYKVAAGGS